jgi:hypothetical protein
MKGKVMNSKTIIALLIVVVMYQSAVIYRDKQIIRMMAQDHAERERFEGYERCIAPIDEARFANRSDEADWLKARQGCRDFWFKGGLETETRKLESKSK